MRDRAEGSGEGTASPGDTGDMMGALTGRAFLSGVDAMAARKERMSTFEMLSNINVLEELLFGQESTR